MMTIACLRSQLFSLSSKISTNKSQIGAVKSAEQRPWSVSRWAGGCKIIELQLTRRRRLPLERFQLWRQVQQIWSVGFGLDRRGRSRLRGAVLRGGGESSEGGELARLPGQSLADHVQHRGSRRERLVQPGGDCAVDGLDEVLREIAWSLLDGCAFLGEVDGLGGVLGEERSELRRVACRLDGEERL